LRVLVTGATGFVGSVLAEKLVARGDRVRAVVRPTSKSAELVRLGAELVLGDLASPPSLSAAVEGCDAVVHLAGAVKALRAKDFMRVNGEGSRAVAEACAAAKHPPRFVYVSSLAAAGPSRDGRPRREEDQAAPVSAYGRSKLAGERAVRAVVDRVQASIVRPPAVYGPRDREFVPRLLRMARLGVFFRLGFGERRYSLVHVSDLCDGILAVLERGRGVARDGPEGVYFLDSGEEHAYREIAMAVCAAAGTRAAVVPLPELAGLIAVAGVSLFAAATGTANVLSFDKLRELRQRAWTCSSERAQRELGYAPRFDLARGMVDAVASCREARG